MKKSILNGLCLCVGIGSAALLAGCAGLGNASNPLNPSTPSTPSSPSDPTPPPANVDLAFDEFIKSNKQDAINFVNDYIRPEVVGTDDVLSEKFSVSANKDNELDTVSFAYSYKTGETQRAVDYVKVSLTDPIDLDAIADKTVKASDVKTTLDRDTIYTFDAKVNATADKNLTDAVFNRVGVASENSIFCENVEGNVHSYSIFTENADSYEVTNFSIKDEGLSTQQLVSLFQNDTQFRRAYVTSSSQTSTFDGSVIYTSSYQAEDYQEDPGHVIPPKPTESIKDVQDLIANYSAEVNEGLQTAYKNVEQKALKQNIPGFSASKVSNAKWDFTTDNNGNITKLNYIGTYNGLNTRYTYFIASVSLTSPINLSDLTQDNIQETFENSTKNATVKYEYDFGYDTTDQNTYQDLATAIFKKAGLNVDGATKFVMSTGSTTNSQLGGVQEYKIVQLTANGINEVEVQIKNASGVDGLIQNVNNNQYVQISQKSYKLGGQTMSADLSATAE